MRGDSRAPRQGGFREMPEERPLRRGFLLPAPEDRSLIRPLARAGALGETWRRGTDSACLPGSAGAAAGFAMAGTMARLEDGNPAADMLIREAAAKAAASGAAPCALQFSLLLPEDYPEDRLRGLMEEIARKAAGSMQVFPGQILVDGQTGDPVLQVTVFGPRERPEAEPSPRPGDALMMAGYAGECGAKLLGRRSEEALRTHFPASFLREAGRPFLSWPQDTAQKIRESGGRNLHAIAGGGVFAALWHFGKDNRCGFEAHLEAVPILQETVEICEYLDVNPYQLYDAGSFLFAADDGAALLCEETLAGCGVMCARIGTITGGSAGLIRNGEELRYLEKPQQDGLFRAALQARRAGAAGLRQGREEDERTDTESDGAQQQDLAGRAGGHAGDQ